MMPADMEVAHLKVARITFTGQDGEYAVMEPARGTSGAVDRLAIKSLTGGMEVEISPANDFAEESAIVTQIQLMGRLRGDWRKRGSVTIFNDSDGGEAMYVDSSVTGGAPTGEVGMPMVFRMSGEHEMPLIDVVFHPSDNSLELKAYGENGEVDRVRRTIKDWMATSKKDFDNL